MDLHKLAADVAAYMGESILLECEPADSPYPDLEERVALMAPGILTDMFREEPVPERLDCLRARSGLPLDAKDGTATMQLPDDYLKLCHLRLSTWKIGVSGVSQCDAGQLSSRFSSPFAGVRGTGLQPLVAEDFDDSGKRCLRISPCSEGSSVAHFIYLPVPSSSNIGTITLPPDLYLRLIETIKTRLA